MKAIKSNQSETLSINQKMRDAVAWLEERYGECNKRMLDCGILLLESKDPNYKIWFHVYEDGLIG